MSIIEKIQRQKDLTILLFRAAEEKASRRKEIEAAFHIDDLSKVRETQILLAILHFHIELVVKSLQPLHDY